MLYDDPWLGPVRVNHPILKEHPMADRQRKSGTPDTPATFSPPPPARGSFDFGANAENGDPERINDARDGRVVPATETMTPAEDDGKRAAPDKELSAIRRIAAVLAELPPQAQARVVRYVVDRYAPKE